MDLPPITAPMILTLAIGLSALLLFLSSLFPFEVVGLLVMVALALSGVLTPEEATSGFSDGATLTVAGVLFLSAGLERTGAVRELGSWIARIAAGGEARLQATLMGAAASSSAFLNNTAVIAMLMPIAQHLGRRQRVPVSRLLMPLSFAGQLGGTTTLIGTSTNLVVAGFLVDFGLPPLQLFDITPPALVLAAVGLVYLMTIGRALLPVRGRGEDDVDPIAPRAFQSALLIQEGSPFIGSAAQEIVFPGKDDLELRGVRRGSSGGSLPFDAPLEEGDLLLVEGTSEALGLANGAEGLCIPGAGRREGREGLLLVEAVVPPRSGLVGRRVRRAGPLAWYGGSVLAVQRAGVQLKRSRTIALESGDLLLVEATRGALRRIQRSGLLVLIGTVEIRNFRGEKALLATLIFVGVVAAAAVGLVPILVSALVGVVAMLLTGCLTPAEAYEEMDWAVLLLLATLIPLGGAMQKTGAADLLAALVLKGTSGFGPYVVLGAMYLLTSLLTEFISNNAAAVVLTPVAVAIGTSLGVSPMPFVIAVMFAASNSFMTPVGYQTNTFVYGPGQYRFTDFTRVGAPLTLILLILAVFVIPVFFPF